jgi:hypothetical protein
MIQLVLLFQLYREAWFPRDWEHIFQRFEKELLLRAGSCSWTHNEQHIHFLPPIQRRLSQPLPSEGCLRYHYFLSLILLIREKVPFLFSLPSPPHASIRLNLEFSISILLVSLNFEEILELLGAEKPQIKFLQYSFICFHFDEVHVL